MRPPAVIVPALSLLAQSSQARSTWVPLQARNNNTQYSLWMADSLMLRGDGLMTRAVSSAPLQAGITQKAFTALERLYPNTPSLPAYIQTSAQSVLPFLSNASQDALAWPLDRLSNGNALFALSHTQPPNNQSTAYAATAAALRQSIQLAPRNQYGGLWYFVYPEWSYLDGMYSLAPFCALTAAAAAAESDAQLDNMAFQLHLLWAHTRNASSGLLVHGYDASRTAVWANPVTGASPHVWARALGWYFMALVDTLELLENGITGSLLYRSCLLDKFQQLATAVVAAVDPATGAWWQVLDRPGDVGNYIESSASAMFAYGLLKGARLGYFERALAAKAKSVAAKAYAYVTDKFVVYEEGGTLGYNGTVSVCSLNSTASYEYYVGQPLKYNSVLGSGAYILASVEYESLAR